MFEPKCSFVINRNALLSTDVICKIPNQNAEAQKLYDVIKKNSGRPFEEVDIQNNSISIRFKDNEEIKIQTDLNLLHLMKEFLAHGMEYRDLELFFLDEERSLDGQMTKRSFFIQYKNFEFEVIEVEYQTSFNILNYLLPVVPRQQWENDKLFNEARLDTAYENFYKSSFGRIFQRYLSLKKSAHEKQQKKIG